MEDKKGNTPSTISAGCDAGSESVYKHQGGQTSITEQQLTFFKFSKKGERKSSSPSSSRNILLSHRQKFLDSLPSLRSQINRVQSEISTLEKLMPALEKFSEEDVQDKLQSKSVPRLSRDHSLRPPSRFNIIKGEVGQKIDREKTSDARQAENEDSESVYKHEGGQTSITEQQLTEDEKFSKKGVRKKLQSFAALSPSSSSGYSSSSYSIPNFWYEEEINDNLCSLNLILPRLQSQISTLEQLKTADKKFPEEDVQDKLQRKSVPGLSHYSSSGYSSSSSSQRILDLNYVRINRKWNSLNSILPHLQSQISTLEKELIVDKKFPEEDVQDEQQSKSVPGLSRYSSSGYSCPSSKRFLYLRYANINLNLCSLNSTLQLLERNMSNLEKLMTADETVSQKDVQDKLPTTLRRYRSLGLDYVKKRKKGNWSSYSGKKKSKTHFTAPVIDSSDDTLDQPPLARLTETVSIKSPSSAVDVTPGTNQDKTPEMGLHATADPSTIQLSPKGVCSESVSPEKKKRKSSSSDEMCADIDPNSYFQLPVRKDTDDGGPSFYSGSTISHEGSGVQHALPLLSALSESDTGDVSVAPVEMDASITVENYSATNTLPTRSHLQNNSSDPGSSKRDSSSLSRSHSVPSLSLTTSADNKTFTRAKSLPDMLFINSFEEFTPDITADENNESYRFQCSCPGLYQCSVTGLLFHMEGEGDVVYRTVPWDRRLLGQHHKQPAGPLFDIKCVQQSMCQLHLPHCEIRSTGGCGFLSVAHVNDDSIEFIAPHKITETHVIINITGFSAFGNVKDEDSPPDPVRAKVLLFYRPPADPDLTSFISVLLLPRNVVLRDVLRTRKNLFGKESLIETSPHCKLHPKQEYKLSTCPEDDSVLVQPTEAEFDCDDFDYFPTFQVRLKTIIVNIKLLLRETKSPDSVWEREVCLSSSAVKRCVQGSSDERLLDIRSSFIDGISGPVLKSLLDKLFEKTVLTDAERESADEIQNKRDKARFVIDTVRKKGEAAGSEMIDFLCEDDPFLSEHLGLI